jgi:hypothetical protein
MLDTSNVAFVGLPHTNHQGQKRPPSPNNYDTIKHMGTCTLMLTLLVVIQVLDAGAADPPRKEAPQETTSPPPSEASTENKPTQPSNELFSANPHNRFGEYGIQSKEEDAVTFFLQNGRFFGVSLGGGIQFLDGNRSSFWTGGFPTLEAKIFYWFDFNFSLAIQYYSSIHRYDTTTNGLGTVDVSWASLGVLLRYSVDTTDLAAPLTFGTPYLTLGFGNFWKTEISNTAGVTDSDQSTGLMGGGGFEFMILPLQTYFLLEARMHYVVFKDTYSTSFPPLPNLTGNFYVLSGSLLLTW